ncbi:retrotransposon hot spot (RHS) protein, putative, partial [Trypanosoma cruzi marinkellei]
RYEKIAVECGVLYITEVEGFPLVDAFSSWGSNPMTPVGLRKTAAGGHHPTASTVGQFTEHVAAYFNGWEELFRDMSWEMIYVQHADSTPMAGWQGRGVVSSDNVSEEEEQRIAAFWKEKVRQYQVSISSEAASRGAALRSGEHPQKWENKLGKERVFDFLQKRFGLFHAFGCFFVWMRGTLGELPCYGRIIVSGGIAVWLHFPLPFIVF